MVAINGTGRNKSTFLRYPKCLKKCQPNLSAQAQKFQIFVKKSSRWVSVVCGSIQQPAGTLIF